MTLHVGDAAPDFTLPVDGGGTLTLAALRGQTVALYFYPKDDTPGCTKQACVFRDTLADFQAARTTVVGVSRDSVDRHDAFKAKYTLPFPLVSDPDSVVCAAYGAWVSKSMYGRTYMGIDRSTVLIDASGIIHRIWRKVRITGHVDAVLQVARALQAA